MKKTPEPRVAQASRLEETKASRLEEKESARKRGIAPASFAHFQIAVFPDGAAEVQNLDHDSSRPPRLAKATPARWLHNSAGECIGPNPNYTSIAREIPDERASVTSGPTGGK